MTKSDYEKLLNLATVKAFLDTIAWAEGGTYNKLYGGGTFTGNQHPRKFIKAGAYTSDAAGRYQFLYSSWKLTANQIGLEDFSPKNQDIGALHEIKKRGELQKVINGDLLGTLKGLGCLWAALPYSGCKQREKSFSATQNYYNSRLKYYGANPSAVSNNSVVSNAKPQEIVNKLLTDIKTDKTTQYLMYGFGFLVLAVLIKR